MRNSTNTGKGAAADPAKNKHAAPTSESTVPMAEARSGSGIRVIQRDFRGQVQAVYLQTEQQLYLAVSPDVAASRLSAIAEEANVAARSGRHFALWL